MEPTPPREPRLSQTHRGVKRFSLNDNGKRTLEVTPKKSSQASSSNRSAPHTSSTTAGLLSVGNDADLCETQEERSLSQVSSLDGYHP